MPIYKDGNNEIQYTRPTNADRSNATGVAEDDDFAICDKDNVLKQIKFNVNPTSAGAGSVTLKLDVGSSDTIIDLTSAGGNAWSLTGNASTTPGTNFIGTSDAQDLEIQTNGITQITYLKDGGSYAGLFPVPVDATTQSLYHFESSALPTSSTTTSTLYNLRSSLGYDSGLTGNSVGSLVTNRSDLTIPSVSAIDFAGAHSNQLSFSAVAGTTALVKGNDTNTNVGAGYTITNLNNVSSYLNSGVGTTFTSAVMYDSGATFDGSIAASTTGLNSNITFTGASIVSGSVSNLSTNILTQDTTDTNQLIGLNTYITTQDTSTTDGITGALINVTTADSSANTNGLQGIALSATSSNSSTNGYITAVQIQSSMSDSSSTVGSVTGANIGGIINGTASASNYSGVNVNAELSGSSVLTGAIMGSFAGQIIGSANVDNVQGVTISTIVGGSATVDNFTGLGVYPQVSGTAAITNDITAINVSFNTTPAVTGVKGINLSVTGANVVDPFAKYVATLDGGFLTSGYSFDIPAANTFFNGNTLAANPTVTAGNTVSSLAFGTNIAPTVTFNDNWTADFTGARLGFASLGVTGQLIGDTGKTMDAYTSVVAATSNPSGSGTLSKYTAFRAGGVTPGGGAITVTDAYAFFVDNAVGGFSATNNYGVFVDGSSFNNYLDGKLRIGGGGYVAPTVELDVTGDAIISGAFTAGGNLSFFGATPAGQQTGGAATAGGTYGATEQTMLQAVYDCLRTFGLLS